MRIIFSQFFFDFWKLPNYPISQLANYLTKKVVREKVVPITFTNILVKSRTFYNDQNSRYLENKKSGSKWLKVAESGTSPPGKLWKVSGIDTHA